MQRKGQIIVKTFSDGVFGGKRKALKAAVDYRDSLLLQHSPVEDQIWVCNRLRKNNTSGIPGVGRYEVIGNRNTGRRDAFWLASWTNEEGRGRKRKFYVSCYGEQEAKRLAIAERNTQLKRVYTLKCSKS